MRLRAHQQELSDYMRGVDGSDLPLDILANVVPGGGKSKLPGLIAERFPKHKIAWFVPRLALARQAAIGLEEDFGITVRPSGNEVNPSRGHRGFVATHAALSIDPDLWRDELRRHNYILVIDELHHAKMGRDGELSQLAAAIDTLPYQIRLSMTGTLETNDNSMIYGVEYDEISTGWMANPSKGKSKTICYDRTTALQENAIVTVEFHYHDGPVKWENLDGTQSGKLSTVDKLQESQAVWTALRTDLADQLLDNCVQHWKRHGRQLLVVTADQQSAKRYSDELRRKGIISGLAISDNDDSLNVIKDFQSELIPCLVTCQMAYEGLDVPEITHIACLTHIRSTPWILQMLARAWRQTQQDKKTKCWVFVPDDPRMNRVIARIKAEDQKAIPFPKDGGGGPPPPRDAAFVPLSGEVDKIDRRLLDEVDEPDEHEEIVAAICREKGVSPDDPRVKAFVEMLRNENPIPQKANKTIDEQEKFVRKQINDLCNKANFAANEEPGFYQKKLFSKTRKSVTTQTLSELQNTLKIAIRLCSAGISNGRVDEWA